MTAPERFADSQIPLAPRAPSIHGPSVWTGRALQAENDDLAMIGPALLYPARKRNWCVPGHHGYPRGSISFASRPRRPYGPPDHERAGETFLHLLTSARRPRRESQLWYLSDPLAELEYPPFSWLPLRCVLHNSVLVPARSRRFVPTYWRARPPKH